MPKVKSGWKLPWTYLAIALAVVASCALAPAALAGEAEAAVALEEPAAACAVEPALAPASPEAGTPAAGEASIGAQTTAFWKFISRENCRDLWQTSCSTAWPPDQCPPNPAGKPCSPPRDTCWLVITSNTVDFYRCTATG